MKNLVLTALLLASPAAAPAAAQTGPQAMPKLVVTATGVTEAGLPWQEYSLSTGRKVCFYFTGQAPFGDVQAAIGKTPMSAQNRVAAEHGARVSAAMSLYNCMALNGLVPAGNDRAQAWAERQLWTCGESMRPLGLNDTAASTCRGPVEL